MEVPAVFQRYLPYTTTQFGSSSFTPSNGLWSQMVANSIGIATITKPAAGQGIAIRNGTNVWSGLIFGDYIVPRIPSILDIDSIIRLRIDLSLDLMTTTHFQVGLCDVSTRDTYDTYHRFRLYYDHSDQRLKVDVKGSNTYAFASRGSSGFTNIYTSGTIAGLGGGAPHVLEFVVYFMKGSTTLLNCLVNIDGVNRAAISVGGIAYLSDTYDDMANAWYGLYPYFAFHSDNIGYVFLSSINIQRS